MISLLAGNARVLLTIDERGSWEQLYYPHPGLHQQLRQVRLGIYDEETERLQWVDREGEPPDEIGYIASSNVARTRSERMGLQITVDNVVHPDKDLVIRRVRLHNPDDSPRHLRVFHYQSMQLAGSRYRETATWDPERRALHHYKRSYHLRFWGAPAFDSFTCGEHTLKGLEGSHVDAEDGDLRGNAVSHGSADSVGQWNVRVGPRQDAELHLFVAIGRSLAEVVRMQEGMLGQDPEMYITETIGYGSRWLLDRRIQPSYDLSRQARELYRRSLFVLRDCSAETGATIASPDSLTLREGGDGYEYCWWRDGAYISNAMGASGLRERARAFLAFAQRCQEPDGSFLHRHFPDGYLGPTWHPLSDIQVDQTASVVEAVHHNYLANGDLEELLSHWELVRRGADFLMGFVGDDGLPLPSFDLWEEKKATSTYATGKVIQALESAAAVARALGRRSEFWSAAAQAMRSAAAQRLWNPERNAFYKSVNPTDDTIDAATLLADILPPGDPRHGQVVAAVEENLWQGGVGGVARYEGDTYFGHENPWIICTLWLAQAHLRLGDGERAKKLIEWTAKRAGPGMLLPEQVDASSGERRGVTPLVWSHSTFVDTVNAFTQRAVPAAPERAVAKVPGGRRP